MNALLAKLKSWIPRNITAILGIIQAVVKFVKEAATLAIDLICPIIPGDSDKKIVEIVRNICNKIDGIIEKIKEYILKI